MQHINKNMIMNLYFMPLDVMLIVRHPSGVVYETQMGGPAKLGATCEGLLAPVGFESDEVNRFVRLPFPVHAPIGADPGIVDMIDSALAASRVARYLTVDRARLNESYVGWVHVRGETPLETSWDVESSYLGAPRGFGAIQGVLTWPDNMAALAELASARRA
jgi:hypothetical protein